MRNDASLGRPFEIGSALRKLIFGVILCSSCFDFGSNHDHVNELDHGSTEGNLDEGPPPPEGAEGGNCRDDGTCDIGLKCDFTGICLRPGSRAAECNPDSSCDAGLICIIDLNNVHRCHETIPSSVSSNTCAVCPATGSCVDNRCHPGGLCRDIPNSWPRLSLITAIAFPADASLVATRCPDFSGDGKGDNGLKGLAGTLNPELMLSFDSGSFVAFFDLAEGPHADKPLRFQLGGLTGVALGQGEYAIDPVSYDSSCNPFNWFDAFIDADSLYGTADSISVRLTRLGDSFVTLSDVRVEARVSDIGEMEDGVLAGIWQKHNVDIELKQFETLCGGDTQPSECSYLSFFKSFIPILFDLDLDHDGNGDAASVCLFFSATPVQISELGFL